MLEFLASSELLHFFKYLFKFFMSNHNEDDRLMIEFFDDVLISFKFIKSITYKNPSHILIKFNYIAI